MERCLNWVIYDRLRLFRAMSGLPPIATEITDIRPSAEGIPSPSAARLSAFTTPIGLAKILCRDDNELSRLRQQVFVEIKCPQRSKIGSFAGKWTCDFFERATFRIDAEQHFDQCGGQHQCRRNHIAAGQIPGGLFCDQEAEKERR